MQCDLHEGGSRNTENGGQRDADGQVALLAPQVAGDQEKQASQCAPQGDPKAQHALEGNVSRVGRKQHCAARAGECGHQRKNHVGLGLATGPRSGLRCRWLGARRGGPGCRRCSRVVLDVGGRVVVPVIDCAVFDARLCIEDLQLVVLALQWVCGDLCGGILGIGIGAIGRARCSGRRSTDHHAKPAISTGGFVHFLDELRLWNFVGGAAIFANNAHSDASRRAIDEEQRGSNGIDCVNALQDHRVRPV